MAPLKVIALISGGKDSFYAALHAVQNGHELVALANLYPGPVTVSPTNENGVDVYDPADGSAPETISVQTAQTVDPNGFMYQTVGHQILPLYAQALQLPLYRRALGTTTPVQSVRDYDVARVNEEDETESMVPLLKEILKRHPEANAVCAGAILSTYQRTRVEAVAVRLGLTPVAYLWKYPTITAENGDDAQLLRDMEAAGMDPRVIKVASAGLDESALWMRVCAPTTIARIQKALKKFGNSEGAVLGEGGEFETLVVDGPKELFKKRIAVPDAGMKEVSEGGGTTYLEFSEAAVEDKAEESTPVSVKTPALLEPQFVDVLEQVRDPTIQVVSPDESETKSFSVKRLPQSTCMEYHWTLLPTESVRGKSIEEQTQNCMDQIRERCTHWSANLPSASPVMDVTHTTILMRDMGDFQAVNTVYKGLFCFCNPPARVTVAVGDMLPEGCDLAVLVTSFPGVSANARGGLHVQSRSYWAPANIGPYSQAIDHGVMVDFGDGGDILPIRIVIVAGQISLIPASMELPVGEPDAGLEIVLSLQHLWRISREMKVQWYTGAKAIFPRAASEEEMKKNVLMAAKAWQAVHPVPVEDAEEEESEDIDVWDQRNTGQQNYGTEEKSVPLPDWEVFSDGTEFTSRRVPPFYAIEVDTLPRNAACEWQVQAGLSRLEPMCLSTAYNTGTIGQWNYKIRHARLREGGVRYIHSSVGIWPVDPSTPVLGVDIRKIAEEAWAESLNQTDQNAEVEMFALYLDTERLGKEAFREGWATTVPCRSVWGGDGERLLAVAIFRTGEIPTAK